MVMDEAKEEVRDPLELPSAEVLREIERKQEARAQEIRERRKREARQQPDNEQSNAAQIIQRNYRGHRERRALKGYGLDPSTRWLEALKDAEYANKTRPVSRAHRTLETPSGQRVVRTKWAQATAVARRAGSDDTSDSEGDEDSVSLKRQQKAERERYAKIMGLEYFLEMVDHKHRYGSNLRRYHKEWMKSDSKDNFFYWLDYGAGKDVDLEDRPRSRLDSEMVRYLSREERKDYLVVIDGQGRFVWNKDGQPITTSSEFKDSIGGIVHKSDSKPTWREVTTGQADEHESSDASSASASISTGSHEDAAKYTNEELHEAKGVAKAGHVSVDSIMNHLLRKTTKSNTWIFVADTSFRLYVGIKQSGAFQHSSFLKGARVSAAGLIKIKRGQIRKLSPLSGHYAPPVKNFREFIRSLRQAGADLSHLNISRSYAVILGLEGYIKVKNQGQMAKQGVKDIMNPEDKRKREEAAKDKSKSAEREREILAKEAQERRKASMSYRFRKRIAGMGDGDGKRGVISPSLPPSLSPSPLPGSGQVFAVDEKEENEVQTGESVMG